DAIGEDRPADILQVILKGRDPRRGLVAVDAVDLHVRKFLRRMERPLELRRIRCDDLQEVLDEHHVVLDVPGPPVDTLRIGHTDEPVVVVEDVVTMLGKLVREVFRRVPEGHRSVLSPTIGSQRVLRAQGPPVKPRGPGDQRAPSGATSQSATANSTSPANTVQPSAGPPSRLTSGMRSDAAT